LPGTDSLPQDAPVYASDRAVITGPADKTIEINGGVLARTKTADGQILCSKLDLGLLLSSRARLEAPGLRLTWPDLSRLQG
jgi:hypothetical protein